MGRRSKSSTFWDFSGGMNADASPTTLEQNQALDLDNIILLPKSGFEKRNPNSVYNSSAMDSGATVHGLGYYRQIDGDEFSMAITGSKLYKSEFDGTMDDITNTLTITTGQNNYWTYSQMNDIAIFVGGDRATDVPIKWAGSGNGAVLGGSPPVGTFGIMAANRFFIGNTVANPSRINWSILGNPEDWSGTGSGSQDVAANDGDSLVGAELLGNDHLIVFKQHSVHELVLSAGSPFPLYQLFPDTGAISKQAILNVDGVIYFVTPEPKMKATDGTKIIDFPDTFDSIWEGLNKDLLTGLQGFYDRKRQLVMWFGAYGSSSTKNFCIAWDLGRQAWLKFSTGHNMNVVAQMRDRLIYGGGFDGKIYLLDDDSATNDASESGAIDAYFMSGWLDMSEMINAKHIPYVDLNFKTQNTGSFDFSYGYDFDFPRSTSTISMLAAGFLWDVDKWDEGSWGGTTDKTKMEHLKGNGKFFAFRLRNNNSGEKFQFNRLAFPVKDDGPKALR